jgi:hypothetical protein
LRGWLRRRLDVVLFALGCAVLVFLAGMVAGQAKLFTYAQLHAASEAEIAPAAGNRTVWEWSNLVEPGYVGLVTDVQRVTRDAVPWLGQPCPKGALPVAGS